MANTERLKKIEDQMAKLKAQKQAILNRDRVQERKARTHRLVQAGAVIEKYFGIMTIEELTAWAENIKAQEAHNQPVANEKTCPKCGSPLEKSMGSMANFGDVLHIQIAITQKRYKENPAYLAGSFFICAASSAANASR